MSHGSSMLLHYLCIQIYLFLFREREKKTTPGPCIVVLITVQLFECPIVGFLSFSNYSTGHLSVQPPL